MEHEVLTPTQRWEQGISHHPRSVALMKKLDAYDWKYLNGFFDWKTGGDGDNGETLMYLLDMIFTEDDAKEPSR